VPGHPGGIVWSPLRASGPGRARRDDVVLFVTLSATVTPARGPRFEARTWLLVPLLVFAWISLIVGTLANITDLTDHWPKFSLFFSDPIHLKVWFATAAVALALFQVFSAAWIFRKLPWPRPAWIGRAHRWSGRLAFLLTLPVAYNCIFLLGFQDVSARTLAHSFAGVFFFGAISAKVLIVRVHRFPRWALPLAGGLVFSTLIAIWWTSSLWFFRNVDVGL
jgi:hypothetical protein